MKFHYAILSKRASLDSRHATATLTDIIEEVNFAGSDMPDGIVAVATECVFSVLWEREEGEDAAFIGKFSIETPRGPWLTMDAPINFEDKRKSRTTIEMDMFPMAGAGIYTFRLECAGVVAAWTVVGKIEAPVAVAG